MISFTIRIPGGGAAGETEGAAVNIARKSSDLTAPLRGLVGGPQFAVARMKFMAWWNGEEFDAAAAAELLRAAAAEGAAEPAPAGHGETWRPKVQDLWNRARIAQWLWGDGHLAPFADDLYVDYAQALLMNSEKSLAILEAGLCGGARAIAKETGVWVSAFEGRERLIEAATEQNAAAGLGKKVVLEPSSPEGPALPEAKFQGVLSVAETIFVEDKKALFASVKQALQKDGGFLCVDYVAQEGAEPSDVSSCFSSHWGDVHLWPADRQVDTLEGLGFDVRVRENVTAVHLDHVSAGWARWRRVVDEIEGANLDAEDRGALLQILNEEAELWANRMAALNDGRLQLYRFLAF
ncbi:MAG: hypothetical protein AAGL49_02490 [Pseudomonadota bacterium]